MVSWKRRLAAGAAGAVLVLAAHGVQEQACLDPGPGAELDEGDGARRIGDLVRA